MPAAELQRSHGALIAPEHPAHVCKEPLIVLRQPLLRRLLLRRASGRNHRQVRVRPADGKQLDVRQRRVLGKHPSRHGAGKTDSVHMVGIDPVAGRLQNQLLRRARPKEQLDVELQTVPVQGPHQLPELPVRIPPLAGISRLRRKVAGLRGVAPVIDLIRALRHRISGALRSLGSHHFFKLVGGHQLHRRHAQLLYIRNLLPDGPEGSLIFRPCAPHHAESPDVNPVDQRILEGKPRSLIRRMAPVLCGEMAPQCSVRRRSPDAPSGHAAAVGVGNLCAVRRQRVFPVLKTASQKVHGPESAGFSLLREINLYCGLFPFSVQKETQLLRLHRGAYMNASPDQGNARSEISVSRASCGKR